jgi:DNA protecting protein DprA
MGGTMEHSPASDPNAAALVGLTLVPGAGRVVVSHAFQAASRLGMSLHELLRTPLLDLARQLPPGSDGLLNALKNYDVPHRLRAEALLQRTTRAGIRFVPNGSAAYPSPMGTQLKNFAPPFLFVRGDPSLLKELGAAVVGARKASRRGLAVAAACGAAFACEGVAVISGGAAGVDTAAHEAATRAGGTTVVILPQGILDYCVPRYLQRGLEDGSVAVISEFVPDAPWETHAAVTRNATISACSSLICVVEPRKTGGSMRTARHGLRQGKPVLAFGEDESASGVRALRSEGAVEMLDERGQVSTGRLMTLWRARRPRRSEQRTLW